MEDEKTIWLKPPVPIVVRVEKGDSDQKSARFTESFKIGRDKSCQLHLKDGSVSRFHAEIKFDGDQWRLFDLKSANGTFLNGTRIDNVPLKQAATVELGRGGPLLSVEIEETKSITLLSKSNTKQTPPKSNTPLSETERLNRYFSSDSDLEAGDHTMAIRRAIKEVRKKDSKKYGVIIGVILLLLIGTGGVVAYQETKLNRVRNLSQDIFYDMKALEIQVAQIEEVVLSTANVSQRNEIASKRSQMKEMEQHYDKFLDELGFYKQKMSEEEKLIYKVARVFGECEVNMPKEFASEVHNYIGKWKSTNRLNTAIARAKTKGYNATIVEAMLRNHLPPQFFYLGLQESNFDDQSIGPKTRFGIAKGIWQFIPSTAIDYGLRTGPLIEIPRYDPNDERFNFNKSTHAAAQYIRNIYNTQAAASGLLVMASYNWGESNIRQMIDQLPPNPRERNFWKLLEHNRIPRETYDYVFYTFSAAVIGENPRLFGFDFENPIPNFG